MQAVTCINPHIEMTVKSDGAFKSGNNRLFCYRLGDNFLFCMS
jgi:hypothetical protein